MGCLVTLAFVWAHLIGPAAYLHPAEASPLRELRFPDQAPPAFADICLSQEPDLDQAITEVQQALERLRIAYR